MGLSHTRPPLEERLMEMPVNASTKFPCESKLTWLSSDAYAKCRESPQTTTGSPPRKVAGSGPGFKKGSPVKLRPRFCETPTPVNELPPTPSRTERTKAPESLKPTTTVSPHQALDVSLWVNPPKRVNW